MKKLFLTLAISLLVFGVTNAQSDTDVASHTVTVGIPEVAVVDIEGGAAGTSINLGATFSGEAGVGLDYTGATNSDLWLNYTSVTSTTDPNRTISVQITGGTVPTGLELNLTAAAPTGVGTLGAPGAALTLTTASAQTVLAGIGSCYTNDGHGEGSNLTYSLSETSGSFSSLTEVSEALTITYTISDN